MVYLIFHTAIIINRKNWRITIKLHFENIDISFKESERTHVLERGRRKWEGCQWKSNKNEQRERSLCLFWFAFQWPPQFQRTYFLNDPFQVKSSYILNINNTFTFFEKQSSHCTISSCILVKRYTITKYDWTLTSIK